MDDATIKDTIAQLRKLQGDENAMQRYLLGFIRQGLQSGITLGKMIETLTLGPGSILRRALYAESEERRLIEFLRSRTIIDLLADDYEVPQ